MSYIDYLLLDKVAYGLQVGPTFNTTEVMLNNGHDRRNANWSRPKHRANAPFQNLSSEDMDQVRTAFNVCQGKAHSFRFFDRFDYELADEVIGTADGTTDQQLQITKSYTLYGLTTTRIITKPVDSTKDYGRGENVLGPAPAMVVKADGTPITATIDYQTGIVTFTATNGQEITVSGWFDIAVRFEDDELFISRDERDAHNASVNLVEDWAS